MEAPILLYHASARSIVFRNQIRSMDSNDELWNDEEEEFITPLPPTAKPKATSDLSDSTHSSETGYSVNAIAPSPLPLLEYGYDDIFLPLVQSDSSMTLLSSSEQHIFRLFEQQQCVVKTLKNTEWTTFLRRFHQPQSSRNTFPTSHDDKPSHGDCLLNSFCTSTSLLPPFGKKMRCYGSPTQYTVGVVFELPGLDQSSEAEAIHRTETWAWPAGYSAKTEFNIDSHGRLINGRKEALVTFHTLRQYNQDYIEKEEYFVGTKMTSGLHLIPYNEVYVRVGGTLHASEDSLEGGLGLPVALFVRTACYGHLITLLRTRARLVHAFGEEVRMKDIPLLLVTPEHGVQVFTQQLQDELWKIAAQKLNPFQNQTIAYRTTLRLTEQESFQQKVEELLELNDNMETLLTPEELAHIAGGFGATDGSLVHVLQKMMQVDQKINQESGNNDPKSHRLQDFVNEGLSAALRAGDYHTSRQLLLLYSLVASRMNDSEEKHGEHSLSRPPFQRQDDKMHRLLDAEISLNEDTADLERDLEIVKRANDHSTSSSRLCPSLPPALDTDRLRSATNSDGLLAVLGAAQVLRVIQDGSALRRVHESIDAIEEWVNYGENNVAFRISSWHDQRTAQGDLKIATGQNSKFMAFVSNKAIANRKAFALQLREAVSANDFTGMHLLYAIHGILQRMHSPCLRLELLQYVLGLDNRYSVLHVSRSIELAATCLDISTR